MAGNKSVGKFLSKLKFLDYLIIIALLLIAVIFYKFLHHRQKWINVTALAYSNVFQVGALKPGDYEADSSGKAIAQLNSFEIVDTPPLNGNLFVTKILILHIKMLVDLNSKNDQLQYKNQPLAAGSQIQYNFNSASIQTYISEIEGSVKKKDETKTITVIIYNQWPWFADAIHVGDYRNDNEGKKEIEVISKSVIPTQVLSTVSTGEVVDYTGSSKVDITLKLRVKVQRNNNYYIFQGYNNIFVGKTISYTMGNTQIANAIVTDIQ